MLGLSNGPTQPPGSSTMPTDFVTIPRRIVDPAARSAGRGLRLVIAIVLVGFFLGGAARAQPKPTRLSRQVLLLYDGQREGFPFSMVHRHASLPLEYLGFALVAHDIRRGLPKGRLADTYAGVVTWFSDDQLPAPETYAAFLARQIDAGTRFAILGNFGFNPSDALLAKLGLVHVGCDQGWSAPYTIAKSAEGMAFESKPGPVSTYVIPVRANRGRVLLEVKSKSGPVTATPIAVLPWGILALHPYLLDEGWAGRTRWRVDPFALFAQAFPGAAPALDLSTENGRRILTAHVDGDGIASMAEMPGGLLAAQVIQQRILEVFPIPTAVSVIESDTSPKGVNPELSPRLEEVARRIFRLPHVEIASHTYSHPFNWMAAAGTPWPMDPDEEKPSTDPDYLPIPGYAYSIAREVNGTVEYINSRLAPPDKKTKVYLWSGDALPDPESMSRVAALGLANLNGDNAVEPIGNPILSMIPSSGRWVGGHYQCYTPAQNENVFTNEWTGPFNGYRRAIDLFSFSESPRRLNAIAIYYHFYSGSKITSLAALREVYRYALRQETMPMAISDYTARVLDFQRATVARGEDGAFVFEGISALRTARIPSASGWPDLARSTGVVGVRDLPQGRYVAFDGSGRATLYLRPEPPVGPYLSSSNGRISAFKFATRESGQRLFTATLSAGVPLELSVGGCPKGAVLIGKSNEAKPRPGVHGASAWTWKAHEAEVTIACSQIPNRAGRSEEPRARRATRANGRSHVTEE